MRTWLVSIRKEKGASQKDVADGAAISQPAYCRIEIGKVDPSVGTAKKIADVLGFPWTRFFED